MSVRKLLTSSLKNPQWYRSVSGKSNAPAPFNVHYLVIAGGGGGGGKNQGGGGGAGGYRTSFSTSGGGSSAEAVLSASTNLGFTVTVGAGGAGGIFEMQGTNGSNSVFGSIISSGGGGGGNYGDKPGLAGGSGGGGSLSSNGGSGINGQGYRGGNMSGGAGNNYPFTWQCAGGGGAGAQGTDQGRAGGSGLASTITGTSVTRAGGGGGAGSPSIGGDGGSGGGGNGASMGQPYSGPERNATPGAVNTGSGGGGGGRYQNESEAAAGGSGVVIIRYSDSYVINSATGLTYSTVNSAGFNITTFTAGTGNVIFTEVPVAPYAYELIETVTLTSPQASVNFNVSGLGNEYQHLQLRMSVRSSHSGLDIDESIVRLNGDSANNYTSHQIYGTQGLAVTATGQSGISYMNPFIASKSENASTFSGVVMDILDPFEPTKNTAVKALSGYITSTTSYRNLITLRSGFWNSTASVTSISIAPIQGPNWTAGSSFQLYGIKAN